VEAYALENACRLMQHQMPDEGRGKSIAIVDFGASTTTFSVLKDLSVEYTRDFAFGGQQLTEEIMRTYGVSMQEAGRLKKEGGLPSNYGPEVLEPFIDDMSQQVSRSLQFYLASGSTASSRIRSSCAAAAPTSPACPSSSPARSASPPSRATRSAA
jgi:type IV pilus assembly protein PilM